MTVDEDVGEPHAGDSKHEAGGGPTIAWVRMPALLPADLSFESMEADRTGRSIRC